MINKTITAYFRKLGKKGGSTAAANMTAEQRSARAAKGAAAREANRKSKISIS